MTSDFYRNKVVLLTGASQGLGLELAKRFSELGALCLLSSRSVADLRRLMKILAAPENAEALPADLSLPGEAERLAAVSVQVHGRVDILVNCAGIGYFALAEEATEERIRQLFEVNTFSPFLLAKALVSGMKNRGGRIVNIVSCAGRVPIPTVGIYGGSKSALAMMGNIMRLELEPAGVAVINVYPGTVETGFEENACRERSRVGLCPGGGCGRPVEEVADEIVQAGAGPGGEVWLESQGRKMAADAILKPGSVDKKMIPLRDKALQEGRASKPAESRIWRLWQVETSFACNMECVMCPWREIRKEALKEGDALMKDEVWEALRPHLFEVAEIDFSGGGEPLLHPRLCEWIEESKKAGCSAGFLTNGMGLDKGKILEVMAAGIDWIGLSADGARAETFERIRRGASFKQFCGNVRDLTSSRRGKAPRVLFNFVMMRDNVGELEEIVRLAADLGVDQVNFKQCDVVRGEQGRHVGLFASKADKEIRQIEKHLRRARKLAKKRGVETAAFSFVPDELAVCGQDPRNSLFVRYDGRVAPCINLAIGGPACFLGEEVEMPTLAFGSLPDDGLPDIWKSKACRFYRDCFEARVKAYDKALSEATFEPSLAKLKETFEKARKAMPPAPEGCRICHYLYDI